LNLAADEPDFEFYDADSPIYTSPRYLPPAKIQNCEVKNAIISHGCSLSDCKVNDAIIGIRSNIGKGANIDHAMIIGADLYESEEQRAALLGAGEIPIGIGEGSVIKNAIIDKNARVGKNCTITNVNNVDFDDNEAAHPNYFIRDGVVVVLQGATIPDGTTI
jgi:glucose-1-phosphate adenylyltransferase